MHSLSEIEAAIKQLPEVEVRQLFDWLEDYLEDAWDEQIKADVKSGRLDQLIKRAEVDIAAKYIKPIDEVLHNF